MSRPREGAGEPFQGAAVSDRTAAADFSHLSSGARLPRWVAAQKNYLDLLYWGDTLSPLGRHSVTIDLDSRFRRLVH